MSPFVIPIVAIISSVVVLPVVVVAAVLGNKFLKIKERELAVREKELEVERNRLEALKLMEANDAIDKARALEGR